MLTGHCAIPGHPRCPARRVLVASVPQDRRGRSRRRPGSVLARVRMRACLRTYVSACTTAWGCDAGLQFADRVPNSCCTGAWTNRCLATAAHSSTPRVRSKIRPPYSLGVHSVTRSVVVLLLSTNTNRYTHTRHHGAAQGGTSAPDISIFYPHTRPRIPAPPSPGRSPCARFVMTTLMMTLMTWPTPMTRRPTSPKTTQRI
jgi:hypothetical protein